jgi:hypothetical protein
MPPVSAFNSLLCQDDWFTISQPKAEIYSNLQQRKRSRNICILVKKIAFCKIFPLYSLSVSGGKVVKRSSCLMPASIFVMCEPMYPTPPQISYS